MLELFVEMLVFFRDLIKRSGGKIYCESPTNDPNSCFISNHFTSLKHLPFTPTMASIIAAYKISPQFKFHLPLHNAFASLSSRSPVFHILILICKGEKKKKRER